MKKLYTLVFALMVLISMTVSVEALEYKTIFRQSGLSAYADWTETNDTAITYTDLFVTKTNDGTDVGVSICTYDSTTGTGSCKSGYTFTQTDIFNIDKKLNSASLSEVDIEVYDWETGATETLNVKADWTGTGDIIKDSFKYSSKSGDIIFKGSSSSSSRMATATGSINSVDLGESSYGGLAQFKSASLEMKK